MIFKKKIFKINYKINKNKNKMIIRLLIKNKK